MAKFVEKPTKVLPDSANGTLRLSLCRIVVWIIAPAIFSFLAVKLYNLQLDNPLQVELPSVSQGNSSSAGFLRLHLCKGHHLVFVTGVLRARLSNSQLQGSVEDSRLDPSHGKPHQAEYR